MAGEEVLDVVEDALDEVVRMDVVKAFFGKQSTKTAFWVVGATCIGTYVGFAVAKRQLQATYEQVIDVELQLMREEFAQKSQKFEKEGEFADPEVMLAKIVEESGLPEATPKQKVDYTKMYEGHDPNPEEGVSEDNEFIVAKETGLAALVNEEDVDEVKAITKNLFEELQQDNPAWDAINELAKVQGRPYVITEEEFLENETEYDQITISWFDGDQTLADDKEQMVEDVEGIVGVDNMSRFGWMCKDKNMVHVRNTNINTEFEVVFSDGEYAKEVLGFQHSDETFQPRARRRSWE